jgi:hypothetical protein
MLVARRRLDLKEKEILPNNLNFGAKNNDRVKVYKIAS